MKKGSTLTLESILFLLFGLANLFPLFYLEFIPSLDGPAHIYNSTLLRELWFPTGTEVPAFFQINEWNFTNWTGHLLLSAFNAVLPFQWAEKLLYFLLVLGLTYSFRFFVLRQQPHNLLLTWLIFPLTWSMFVFYGFYNFILGTIFYLLFTGIFISPKHKHTPRAYFLLFILGILCVASHVFCFATILMSCGFYILWDTFSHRESTPLMPLRSAFLKGLKRIGVLLLILLPGLIVTVLLFRAGSVDISGNYANDLTKGDIIHKLTKLDPLIGLVRQEEMFTAKFGYILGLMTGIIILIRLIRTRKKKFTAETMENPRSKILFSDVYFVLFIASLTGFIVAALWFETGKYLSERILYIALLFLIAWICLQNVPRWFAVIFAGAALVISAGLMIIRVPIMQQQQGPISEYTLMAKNIKSGSVVYSINFLENWFQYHYSNYLGAEKPVIMLDNYECDMGYFPLVWMPDKKNLKTHIKSFYPCIPDTGADGQIYYNVLFTSGESAVCNHPSYKEFSMYLSQHYRMVSVSPSGALRLYQPI